MATGYFIHQGDRTTCGGTVLEGETRFRGYGIPRAREGDRVTCGKGGHIYSIAGGLRNFMLWGRLAAGSLDSVSTCPCQAQLIPSHSSFRYIKETIDFPSSPGVSVWNTPPMFGVRFQIVGTDHYPIKALYYALVKKGLCIRCGVLDGQGFSDIEAGETDSPIEIAVSAPSPSLESIQCP
ncbi:PAAR domain-containing protein [Pseudomonas sp. KNUC1026]|uniref:PAAR domain-containing protein n=1 Tax=Pseudomonas sp. KNUC1026 TaxID=2893890 RepID=UPI001F4338D9|nr:PAAR domain-containing protein [Pseudomonas sp. KNUC1026]UFH50529.1 PAAR domain-containing protein [Pseudomonas sp. KNUC1026]